MIQKIESFGICLQTLENGFYLRNYRFRSRAIHFNRKAATEAPEAKEYIVSHILFTRVE